MQKRNLRSIWLRRFTFAAAFGAILLVATGVPFWHTDAPGSADTCPICHVAHISALPGAPNALIATLLTVEWVTAPEARFAHAAPTALDAPPRAPPV